MSRSLEHRASIFNFPRKLVVLGNAEQIIAASRSIGVDGILYSNVRNIHGRKVARRLATSGVADRFQQSFAGGNMLENGILGDPKRLAYIALMGTLERSMDHLVDLQDIAKRITGEPRPVIIHPNEQSQPNKRRRINYKAITASNKHGPLIHQPTVEELIHAKIIAPDLSTRPDHAVQLMREWQAENGFADAVALDVNHLLAERMTDVGPRRLSLEFCTSFAGALAADRMLDYPGEIQVSYQTQLGGDRRNLLGLLDGTMDETPYGKILSAIASSLPAAQHTVRVTYEILPGEFNNDELRIGWVKGNNLIMQAIGQSALA